MANKYIIDGAANNGDGTASNEAASSGAAGAWNNINVFEGTTPGFGTLAAGDVVYIRSKKSGGAAMTYTLAADKTLGSATATATAPITWVFDTGTVWAGVDGDVTYTTATSANECTCRVNNHIKHDRLGGLIFEYTGTSPSDATKIAVIQGTVENAKFLATAVAAPARFSIHVSDGARLVSPIIKWGQRSNDSGNFGEMFTFPGARGECVLVNPDIEWQHAGAQGPLFMLAQSVQRSYKVFGGRLYGAGASFSGTPIVGIEGSDNQVNGSVLGVGFQFPRTMKVLKDSDFSFNSQAAVIEFIGCDGGVGGHIEAAWGWATSRTDDNPPTLNTAFPNSTDTPWAWRVYPDRATFSYPCKIPSMQVFTDTAAAQIITQEVLIANTMSPTKANTWAEVCYTDNATGLPKFISTHDPAGGALTSSTAAWSATTWGAVSCNKHKLAVTTPTAVKKDTPITVTFWTRLNSANALDILFLDPGFSVVPA